VLLLFTDIYRMEESYRRDNSLLEISFCSVLICYSCMDHLTSLVFTTGKYTCMLSIVYTCMFSLYIYLYTLYIYSIYLYTLYIYLYALYIPVYSRYIYLYTLYIYSLYVPVYSLYIPVYSIYVTSALRKALRSKLLLFTIE